MAGRISSIRTQTANVSDGHDYTESHCGICQETEVMRKRPDKTADRIDWKREMWECLGCGNISPLKGRD